MKRLTIILALGLCTMSGPAHARSVGVGGFAGMNIPIVQDDNGSGPTFGLRVPVEVLSHLTVEPFFASSNDGDVSRVIGGLSYTRSGFSLTSFGANALLPFGHTVRFYPFVGLNTNSLKRTGSETLSMFGFGGGLGIGISPSPKFVIHIRGEATNMSKDKAGRVFANVTGGVSYTIRTFDAK